MAGSSGTYKEGSNQQGHGSASPYKNGNSVHGEWGVPTFQHQKHISMEWTPEEQAILEDGLAKYAPEMNIICCAKIAVQLKTKTVRDVSLRCKWMTKKGIKNRMKDDLNARKNKERKELVIDPPGESSRMAIQSGLSHAPGPVSKSNEDIISYNDMHGATQQLLQHNAWVFKQISINLATHQVYENIGLMSKARDNIFQILTNLNEMAPTMKKMSPLPKLNDDLANSILPPSNFPIQL